MQIKRTYLLMALLGIANLLNAQIPVGSWRTHLSYGTGTCVTASDEAVYSISDGSLYAYRFDDQSVTTYSKLDGLSDVFMSIARFDFNTNKLLMGYENGNIDVLSGSNIHNIPDLKLKTITGSKIINNVRFKDNYAYMALDFGIVVLNMDRYEIKETYQLNFGGVTNAVHDLEFSGDTLFAATDLGLYYGLLTDNLIDTRNWKNYNAAPESDKPYYILGKVSDYIIGVRSDNKVRYSAYVINGLSHKRIGLYTYLNKIQTVGNVLYMYTQAAIFRYNESLSYIDQQNSYNFQDGFTSGSNSMAINDGLNLSESTIYVSDANWGLVKVDWMNQSTVLTPNGPVMNNLRRMAVAGDGLKLVHGGVTSSWNNSGTKAAVSRLSGDFWDNLSTNNTSGFKDKVDLMDIVTDPNDPEHYYTSSWGFGVFEFQGDNLVNRYDEFNSSLQNIIAGGPFVRTNGMTFDDEGNLWVTNSEVPSPISCLKTDGSWTSLTYPEIDNGGSNKVYALGKIMITSDKNKWVVVPRNLGLFVFNTNGTIDNVSDDKKRFLTVYSYNDDGEQEIMTDVHDIVQDLDGTIWVATSDGPALYYNVNNVLENNAEFPAYRIKIPRNDGTGRADYLLGGEKIQAIAVDGGNRKWIGTTTSGLFLLSPDGLETIEHFTVDNSPLLSNNILDIEIDQESGEVYIATDKGLISYRSDATGGGADFSDLKVFPNPVREDYTGDVIITGLVADTKVKITDISGNLVYETTSNGGTASWNAKNFYGHKVGTGVYLIFCSDKTGENSAMVKVMVIN